MPKLKWDINTEEPEDQEQYEPYDGPLPPSGVYYVRIPRMQIVESRNGDDMYKAMWFIDDPRDGKRRFEGYGPGFENIPVLEQTRWKAKQMATALQVTWRDLVDKTITESGERPTTVKSIGKVKWGGKTDVMARVQLRRSNDPEYGERLELAAWLPWKDPEDLDRDDADDEGTPEDDDTTGIDGEADDAPDDDGSDETEETDEDARRAELDEMEDDDLLALAEELGLEFDADEASEDDWAALIDDILAAEQEDESDDEDKDVDDDPRRTELEEMSRGQLVKVARGLGIRPIRSSMTEEQLVDAILEREESGEEPEPEPEPEPAPRRTRGAKKAAPAKAAPTKRQTGRRGSKGKAPF